MGGIVISSEAQLFSAFFTSILPRESHLRGHEEGTQSNFFLFVDPSASSLLILPSLLFNPPQCGRHISISFYIIRVLNVACSARSVKMVVGRAQRSNEPLFHPAANVVSRRTREWACTLTHRHEDRGHTFSTTRQSCQSRGDGGNVSVGPVLNASRDKSKGREEQLSPACG